MKIELEELKKIEAALNSVEGWKIKDFKAWETVSGLKMITIRLEENEDRSKTKRFLTDE